MLLVILLQIVPALASVLFEDCGSAYDLRAVNIKGCGMAHPCVVTLGEDVPVNLEFRAGFKSQRLDQNVILNINHVNLRTRVTPELCDSAMCPVNTDDTTYFSSIMSVPVNIALNQRGYLRWQIYNEHGVLVLCYSTVVQTQSPRQKLLRAGARHTPAQPHSP